MSSQLLSLIDGLFRREIESLERRKYVLEQNHLRKVQLARALADGRIENASQNTFRDQRSARNFLAQCSMKPTDAPSIQTAPLTTYHEWEVAKAEVDRTKLLRHKLMERVRSELALGRLEVA